MNRKKISDEEQKALRNDARNELIRLEQLFSDDATIQLLDRFKNKFNICETVYKVILAKHQRNKKKESAKLHLDMKQVPYALKFAGYSFDKELLDNLFSSKTTSAKKLRNAVTHGINEKAVHEITNRQDELFGYMDTFLSTIRNFDNEAA